MSNISFNDAKLHVANKLKNMFSDWKTNGYVNSLTSYCEGTSFPYSHLRKMEGMGLLKSFTESNRKKTYQWTAGEDVNFESLAALIINSGNPSRKTSEQKKNSETSNIPEFNYLHIGKGQNAPMGFQRVNKQEPKDAPKDQIKTAVKIALILKENGVPDDKVESITSAILPLIQ